MHDLDAAQAALAQAADLVQRQRRVAAVDVADDVGVRLQHRVGVDVAGARHRGAAGVDRALDAIHAVLDHRSAGQHLGAGWLARRLIAPLVRDQRLILAHLGDVGLGR